MENTEEYLYYSSFWHWIYLTLSFSIAHVSLGLWFENPLKIVIFGKSSGLGAKPLGKPPVLDELVELDELPSRLVLFGFLLAVLEHWRSLLDEGGHAFAPVLGRERRVQQSAFQMDAG